MSSLSCIVFCHLMSRYHRYKMDFLNGTFRITRLETKANTMVVIGSKCQDKEHQCSKARLYIHGQIIYLSLV